MEAPFLFSCCMLLLATLFRTHQTYKNKQLGKQKKIYIEKSKKINKINGIEKKSRSRRGWIDPIRKINCSRKYTIISCMKTNLLKVISSAPLKKL